jgi:hypothetical protein
MGQAYQSSWRALFKSLIYWIVSGFLLCFCYYRAQRVLGALLALIFLIIAFEYKGSFVKSYRKGQAFERAAMLFRGLGQTSDPGLEPEYSEDWLRKKSQHYQRYFFSTRPQGPRLLLEDIAESSYFVKDIARRTHDRLRWMATASAYSIIFSILFVITLYLNRSQRGLTAYLYQILNSAVPPAKHKDVLEAFLLILGFIAAGELASLTRQYGYLSRKMRHVYDLAVHHLESQQAPDDATAKNVLLEYSALLMESPPLPDFFYSSRREELNYQWQCGKGLRLAEEPLRIGERTTGQHYPDRPQMSLMSQVLPNLRRFLQRLGSLLGWI